MNEQLIEEVSLRAAVDKTIRTPSLSNMSFFILLLYFMNTVAPLGTVSKHKEQKSYAVHQYPSLRCIIHVAVLLFISTLYCMFLEGRLLLLLQNNLHLWPIFTTTGILRLHAKRKHNLV